jgi:hypothetical protein
MTARDRRGGVCASEGNSTPRHRRHDPGLAPFTSATRHRGALTVVEPTISVALRVEAHRERRDYGLAAEATPVGNPPSRSEAGVRAAKRRGAQRQSAQRRGTRAALTPRPSVDYSAPTSVFWRESSRERRHYIRSYGSLGSCGIQITAGERVSSRAATARFPRGRHPVHDARFLPRPHRRIPCWNPTLSR